jgi:hypothetical protein
VTRLPVKRDRRPPEASPAALVWRYWSQVMRPYSWIAELSPSSFHFF